MSMPRISMLRSLFLTVITLIASLIVSPARADWALNMTQGVTPISHEVYDLHMKVLWIVTIIGIIVFGAIFWSIMHHRKDKGAIAAKFHHSTVLELLWTAIPIAILVLIAIPATKTLVAMEKTEDADITLKVTGYQWKWKYDYMGEGVSFFSVLNSESRAIADNNSDNAPEDIDHYLLDVDNPVVLPVNKKIRILTTGADVIHAWWVPALGWKRDAIPGFINDNWTVIQEPGVYRGQCAELCGKDHGFMPIVVKAVAEDEYNTWLAEMKQVQADASAGADREWTKDELVSRGEEVYAANCVACHQSNGKGVPGAFPALDGSAIATGPKEGHMHIVMNGKAGTAMAAFASQLNDVDLAAVITYERNSWGNSTGDMVQPSEVKAAR